MPEQRVRQRTSQACVPCGQRKTKCDGLTPCCRICETAHRRCYYGVSRRNKAQKRALCETPGQTTDVNIALADALTTPDLHRTSEPESALSVWPPYDYPHAVDKEFSSAPRTTASADGAHPQDFAISSEVSARLFSSYLAHVHPIWPILYLPMYEQNSFSSAFPQPVLYAIYAIAACTDVNQSEHALSSATCVPSPAVLFESALLAMQRRGNDRAPLSTHFHPLNMLKSSIENVQALTILALQQHGLGEASNAAILCSIAAGMAIDLRLNEAQPTDSDHSTKEVASRLWWNLYILDKMLEIERGRPFRLRIEDVTTPWPSTSESDEYQLIKVPDAGTRRSATIKTHGMSGFEKTIQLANIMESVAREVGSVTSKHRLCNDLSTAERARLSLCQRLKDYQNTLYDSNIALRTVDGFRATVPPVAIINAIVCPPKKKKGASETDHLQWSSATLILLNRPFLQWWLDLRWAPSDSLEPELHPQQLCINAADEIHAIISNYRDYLAGFPCDTIFPIVLAAAIIWQFSAEINHREEGVPAHEKLDQCVRCLSVISLSWQSAARYRERLAAEMTRFNTTAQPAASSTRYPGPLSPDITISSDAHLGGSGTPANAILNFFEDRNNGLGANDSTFRDFLETRLSRMSSPTLES